MLVDDPTVQRAALYLGAALVGQMGHGLKKWGTGEACLWDWFIRQRPGRTVAAVCTNLGAAAAVLATGAVDSASLGAVIGMGLAVGYSADSLVNRGAKK